MTSVNQALARLEAILLESQSLKALPRTGWVRAGIEQPETVAAHSWGVAFLALTLCPEALDRDRAVAIAIVHDLAEMRVGDIAPHQGIPKSEQHRREKNAWADMVPSLPGGELLEGYWEEFEHGSSAEGRFVRSCDKLDMALQARRRQADHGIDLGEFIRSALQALDDPTLRTLAGKPKDSGGRGDTA